GIDEEDEGASGREKRQQRIGEVDDVRFDERAAEGDDLGGERRRRVAGGIQAALTRQRSSSSSFSRHSASIHCLNRSRASPGSVIAASKNSFGISTRRAETMTRGTRPQTKSHIPTSPPG